MTAQLRSELLKQRTTPTILWLLLSMIVLLTLVLVLHVATLSSDLLDSRAGQLRVLDNGTLIGALFASVCGALAITSEFRHGTIRPTLLANPRRSRVILAKVAASACAGVVLGVLAEALAAGIEGIGLSARGIRITLSGGDYAQLLVGGGAAAAVWAAIGVGVGAIVRNQVGALVGLCVWLLFIENILADSLPSAGRFTPGAAANAIAGTGELILASKLLAPALGALLLIAYAAAATAVGSITTERRDIA